MRNAPPQKKLYQKKLATAVSLALCVSFGYAGASEFIPALQAHDKPAPYSVLPLYNLTQPGGEMPNIQPQAEPTPGALDTVANSLSRNVIVGSSYNSATGGQETFADVRLKTSKFYTRLIFVDESAGSYDGGSGEEQRFGYERQAGQIVLGVTPRASTDIKFIYIRDVISDNKTTIASGVPYNSGTLAVAEGFGMDPVDTDREIVKLMWDEQLDGEYIKNIHLDAFHTQLNREADNYSLRSSTASANKMQALIDRNMQGLNFSSDINISDVKVNLGLKYTDISHDAQRNGGPTTSGLDAISAYQYPGVKMDEWLFAVTSEFDVTTQQQITFGVNYKFVDADATKVNLNTSTPYTGNISALDLYQTYYGSDVDVSQAEGHLSSKLQWAYQSNNNFDSYVSIANFYRSPDTQERYHASASFVPSNTSPMGPNARLVGNPEIDWELHRRAEIGLSKASDNWLDYGRTKGKKFSWKMNTQFYYDNIKDFITRDRATGQTATGVADYARIWRNVDAQITGLDIDISANITNKISSRIALNITDGDNTSDDRNLYGIAPFEANLFLDYFDYLSTGGTWNIGTQIRYVAENDDVDDDPTEGSGYDAGETDEFVVVNFYGEAQLSDRFGVKLGVNNITNESYFDSMAQSVMDGNASLVEAPERTFYVAVTANF